MYLDEYSSLQKKNKNNKKILIYNKNKVKRGCTTCANCVHVRDYPGFVTGEECECSVGLKCDTVLDSVRNCEKYVEYNIENHLNWQVENERL